MDLQPFSHIYIERDALPDVHTQKILSRLKRATIVEVDNYKEVLSPRRQSWLVQKRQQKLIIAIRRGAFAYPGTSIVQSVTGDPFYYNTLALNCLYDCHYCYLQGMYPSAHLVLFVNIDEYLQATDQLLAERERLYLCLSYDTDILPLECFVPYTSTWLAYVRNRPELTVEIRTKSAAVTPLLNESPLNNVVVAWTLAPESVIKAFESGTPTLSARLRAIEKVAAAGWKIRLCFDPICPVAGWQAAYSDLIEEIAERIPSGSVRDITVGTFRIPRSYFDQMARAETLRWRFSTHGGLTVRDGLLEVGEEFHTEAVATVRTLAEERLRVPVHV